MKTKLNTLKEYAVAGDWQKAISIAAKFQRLGNIRNIILDAHLAYTNPRFMSQIGKDVDKCKDDGKSALINFYSIKH